MGYRNLCFLTVDREDNHPLKPPHYKNVRRTKKFGFTKTALKVEVAWPTITKNSGVMSVSHHLTFWIK